VGNLVKYIASNERARTWSWSCWAWLSLWSSSLHYEFLLPCGNCCEINANSRSGMMQAQGVDLDAAWVDCNEKVSKMRTLQEAYVFPLYVCYWFVLLHPYVMDGVALPGWRCSAGVGLAAKLQQRTQGEGELSLKFFFFVNLIEEIEIWHCWLYCSPPASSNQLSSTTAGLERLEDCTWTNHENAQCSQACSDSKVSSLFQPWVYIGYTAEFAIVLRISSNKLKWFNFTLLQIP
jgi:hypothetical protein